MSVPIPCPDCFGSHPERCPEHSDRALERQNLNRQGPPMVRRWRPGDCDPLGNPLRLCFEAADCPYPCRMSYPHVHSIIAPGDRSGAEHEAAALWRLEPR